MSASGSGRLRNSSRGRSFAGTLKELEAVAPDAPILALGQSPLWDEAVKSVIASRAGRPMITGIHDLDYFSRIRAPLPGAEWQIVARNDGTSRDIWIAAGELSALFGAEVCPTRQALADAGVQFKRALPTGKSYEPAMDRATSAWGWRGLAENQIESRPVRDIPAREIIPHFLKLLQWGIRESTRSLAAERKPIQRFHAEISALIKRFGADHPDANLTELFKHVFRNICERLDGSLPANVTLSSAYEVFTFNRKTAVLPRFRFVEHFLNSEERRASVKAYDAAVADSGIAEIGDGGAIPFDVYVPGRGRGTLHVMGHCLRIDLDEPLEIGTARPVQNLSSLACHLEKVLGPEIALIGKAVTLIPMICGEFVMLLMDTGSAYVPRTHRMVAEMKRAGMASPANPILRLRARTWNSFSAIKRRIILPPHLKQAFKVPQVTTEEFSRHWRAAAAGQKQLIRTLAGLTSSCELVRFLGSARHEDWYKRFEQCQRANATLLEVQRKAGVYRQEQSELRQREDEVGRELREIERRRGELNRGRLRPLKRAFGHAGETANSGQLSELRAAELEGQALLMALEAKQKERRHLIESRDRLGRKLRALERGPKAVAARRLLRSVERAAQRVRLELARNAILASEGLAGTDVRPSSWWFPAVDPSGRWFERVASTANGWVEALGTEDE